MASELSYRVHQRRGDSDPGSAPHQGASDHQSESKDSGQPFTRLDLPRVQVADVGVVAHNNLFGFAVPFFVTPHAP